MSSKDEHAVGAFVAVGLVHAFLESQTGAVTAAPLLTGALASQMGSLPDLFEPATCHNHRQFFHSLVFAGIVAHGVRRTYEWRPDDASQWLLRLVGLAIGESYLTHLAMDFNTPRSLPWIGKL